MNIPESHLAQEAIAALVDGELAGGPAARAARHLAGCAQCRMAVQAQREAKDALHTCSEVAVPGDLLSRLCAIPFTADVPGAGGGLSAGPGQLTVSGPTGSWSVPLTPPPPAAERPGHARWLRRGVAGTIAGLGLGVTVLALGLPADVPDTDPREPASVAGSSSEQRTEIAPPVVRSIILDTTVGRPGGTP
ncbi:anti-sigma factor family protein [Geodermatophilus sabuli]|uniref:Putative zinc-finger n=1 Tax=Geodermatophilus sabuli TaxID=1564158 RepID=A0A285EIW3_9ACTN|nr:zf-HC2 domain-containing protein [Geodermatophilus sabuli]MBB3082979.1 anti-sigma factor RsiW [Geodermatophilus sabuli]SNX97976.1 Putative zinc-finger [Geodermatophilus sabuli]